MPDPILARPTPWETVILVCGKCSRKLDGGFGPKRRDTLRTALNDELRARGRRRRVRVVETKCLGLCPKKAVAALNADRPATLLAIPRGSAGADALAALAVGNGRGCVASPTGTVEPGEPMVLHWWA